MAQLAIPSAPRSVGLLQVPGALRRVGRVGMLGVVLTLCAWAAGLRARAWLAGERGFFEGALEVTGTVADVQLPRFEDREGGTAKLRVLYKVGEADLSASNVLVDALTAEGLGRGARVTLLVDPAAPGQPREKAWAESRQGLVWLGSLVLGAGLLVTLALVAWEVRRAVRRQLSPLRTGAIVWLTPTGRVPEVGKGGEVSFRASYYRDDVLFEVTASASGSAWVRNGEKVLAALVPGAPTWVRVIDEGLARRLGWFR